MDNRNLLLGAAVLLGSLLGTLLLQAQVGQPQGSEYEWDLVAGGLSPAFAYDGAFNESREGMFLVNRRTGKVYTWITTYNDDLDDSEQEEWISALGVEFFMPVGVVETGQGSSANILPLSQQIMDFLNRNSE